MEYKVKIGDKDIVLVHDDLDSSINVDDLTKIDTSNLFGEAVTMSAAVNRIGLIKAEVGALMNEARLEEKVYEANFKEKLRAEAASNKGKIKLRVGNEDIEIKITESYLNTSFENDSKWIKIKKQHISAEKNFNYLEALYWAMQDKSRKLNGLVNGTTPEDFVEGLIESKVNGLMVKKGKTSSLK